MEYSHYEEDSLDNYQDGRNIDQLGLPITGTNTSFANDGGKNDNNKG
jgi:hypothetical protein